MTDRGAVDVAQFALGDRTFARKTDAVEHIRSILNGTELGATVTDPLVYALLDRHPYAADKKSRGVAGIEVHINEWNQRAFTIRTDDGGLVVFSFRECFKPSTPAQDAKSALRWEIREQITDFRRRAPLVCATLGIPVTYVKGRPDSAEVDHAPPATFDALAESWAGLPGGWGAVDHVQVDQHREIGDPEQREHWRTYHLDNATLRLLSARAHRNVSTD